MLDSDVTGWRIKELLEALETMRGCTGSEWANAACALAQECDKHLELVLHVLRAPDVPTVAGRVKTDSRSTPNKVGLDPDQENIFARAWALDFEALAPWLSAWQSADIPRESAVSQLLELLRNMHNHPEFWSALYDRVVWLEEQEGGSTCPE